MKFHVILMYASLLYLSVMLGGAGLIPPFKLELNITEQLTKS
jgi:hypothetical protein